MVPAGALTVTVESVVDRAVVVPLVKGEPILEEKLADKAAGRGMAAIVPKGMRAFSIQTIHAAAGVGGFILPGNRVDVLLTTSSSGRDDPTGGGATTTLLQNIEVLAVAQNLDAPKTNAMDPKERVVTLLVTPDHAAILDLAMNKGKLHLSLRNPQDEVEADTRPAFFKDLRFRQESPLPSQFATTMGNLIGAVGNAFQNAASDDEVALPKKERPLGSIQVLRGSHRGGPIRVQRR